MKRMRKNKTKKVNLSNLTKDIPHTESFKFKWKNPLKLKQNAKQNYQNARNKKILKIKNSNNELINNTHIKNNKEIILTKGQKKFLDLGWNLSCVKNTKKARPAIQSFHFKVVNRALPWNEVENCPLCKTHKLSEHHLLLECSEIEKMERKQLENLKIKEEKIDNLIKDRKQITKNGDKFPEIQSLVWTKNWAIWKKRFQKKRVWRRNKSKKFQN